ncbi:MAG: hypothetical protein AAB965_04075 [Patescibacteria group bacterium]
MPPEKLKNHNIDEPKDATQTDPDKEKRRREQAEKTLANIEKLKKSKDGQDKKFGHNKPTDPEKEKTKRERAEATLKNIEAIQKDEERDIMKKLEREFQGIDKLIDNEKDPQMKQTLIGLKLTMGENLTLTKKMIGEIRKAGIKKLL